MKIVNYALIIFLLLVPATHAQHPLFKQVIYLYAFIGDSNSEVSLKDARALSVDLSGSIYVCDTGNNRILKFDSHGKLSRTISGFGWEKEQFYMPYDICANSVLDIFVADYNNHRIQRYDKDFNYISSLYSHENWEQEFQFAYPKAVDVSVHGNLFLIDGENTRILKFNSFGEPEISFGDFSEGKGRLLEPVQLAISSNDQIYVSDSQANKIVVFDYFGNYLFDIGVGLLKQPQGIFFSRLKLLFVADNGNKQVVVFTPKGDLVFKWSFVSKKIGTFTNPMDVVSYKNRVYVLDDDRVFVFELD